MKTLKLIPALCNALSRPRSGRSAREVGWLAVVAACWVATWGLLLEAAMAAECDPPSEEFKQYELDEETTSKLDVTQDQVAVVYAVDDCGNISVFVPEGIAVDAFAFPFSPVEVSNVQSISVFSYVRDQNTHRCTGHTSGGSSNGYCPEHSN